MSGIGRTACPSVDFLSHDLFFDLAIDLRLPGSSDTLSRIDDAAKTTILRVQRLLPLLTSLFIIPIYIYSPDIGSGNYDRPFHFRSPL